MGTYAVYRVWAGVLAENIPSDISSALQLRWDAKGYSFIREAMLCCGGIKKSGLQVRDISMHGETIGVGVEIQNFDWVTEISPSNLFDTALSDRAKEVLRQINQLFEDLNIPLTARLYHHLDLGG